MIISPSGQKNNEFATWDLTKKYRAGDLVVYASKIYEANDIIPENTPFTTGVTGATWLLAVDYLSAITPAGADSQVQFNDNGALGASPRMKFVLDTDTMEVFNLAVTNNVNSSLIPGSAGTFDIGDSTMTWKDLYVSSNVHISDQKISANATHLDLIAGANTWSFNEEKFTAPDGVLTINKYGFIESTSVLALKGIVESAVSVDTGDGNLSIVSTNFTDGIRLITQKDAGSYNTMTFDRDGALTLPGNLTVNGNTALGDISNVKIDGGISGQVLSTDGSGVLTWTTAGGATTGIISGTGAQDYQVATSNPTTRSDGSSALVEGDLWYDTSSGDLKIWNSDVVDWALVTNTAPPSIINGMSSVQAAPTNILFVVGGLTTMSMTSNGLELKGFTETVTTPAFNATFAPNVSLSTIVKFTATSNFTFNGFTSPVPGQSATIIITQDATGSRLMTSTMKFNGGVKTLSTAAGAIDIISVFYDGAAYYASLTIGYV
jgi:hypothetical protein